MNNDYDLPAGTNQYIREPDNKRFDEDAHLPTHLVSWYMNSYYVKVVEEQRFIDENHLAEYLHEQIVTAEWIEHVNESSDEDMHDLHAYMNLFWGEQWDDVKGTDFYYALGKKMGWMK